MLNVLLALMGGHLLGLIVLSFLIKKSVSAKRKQSLAKLLLIYSALAAPLALGIVVVA